MYLCCLETRRRRAVYVFARLFSRSRPLLGNFAAPARPREQMPVVRASGSRARATSGATQRLRQPFAGFSARMLTRRQVGCARVCAASQVHQACCLPQLASVFTDASSIASRSGRLLEIATPRLRRVAREAPRRAAAGGVRMDGTPSGGGRATRGLVFLFTGSNSATFGEK